MGYIIRMNADKHFPKGKTLLYLHEYPLLLRQIERLVALVRADDPNVTLLERYTRAVSAAARAF